MSVVGFEDALRRNTNVSYVVSQRTVSGSEVGMRKIATKPHQQRHTNNATPTSENNATPTSENNAKWRHIAVARRTVGGSEVGMRKIALIGCTSA
jgi:hypothetical protein